MSQSVAELEVEIARIRDTQLVARGLQKDLERAENQLAYLKATVLVVVNDGKEIKLYGISQSCSPRVPNLTLHMRDGETVMVGCAYAAVRIPLKVYGEISFEVCDKDEPTARYTIWAFWKSDEAKAKSQMVAVSTA